MGIAEIDLCGVDRCKSAKPRGNSPKEKQEERDKIPSRDGMAWPSLDGSFFKEGA